MRNDKIRAGLRRANESGFTLAEMVIATSLSVVVAAAAYTLLTSALKLYSENFSLNHSHQIARLPLERMIREINDSGCPPVLVDEKGADVAGNGPAPGIRYCTLVSAAPYTITAAATAASTSVSVKVNTGQAKPRDSDILLIQASAPGQPGNGIQVEISAVTGTISPYTVTLKTALGADVAINSSVLILQQGAFIASGGQLRYYNKVMSEAKHGTTVFNAPSSFRALAQVEPVSGQTQATPFSYAPFASYVVVNNQSKYRQDLDPRILRVNLRARSAKYSNLNPGKAKSFVQVADFHSFLDMQSSIAVKSVYVDSTKFNAIQ
jgi:prepilin-type N-terminal cleavage/methylation domain-containing protein